MTFQDRYCLSPITETVPFSIPFAIIADDSDLGEARICSKRVTGCVTLPDDRFRRNLFVCSESDDLRYIRSQLDGSKD